MILSANQIPLQEYSLPTPSFQTLEVGLISKGKDCLPYWNKFVKEQSEKLWLPIKTDWPDLDLSLLNGWQTGSAQRSWFSTKLRLAPKQNSQETFYPYFTSSPVESTISGVTVRRSRKIRLYPNSTQRQLLRRYLGTSRFVYNFALNILQESTDRFKLSAFKSHVLNSLPAWAKEIPFAIKGDSCIEAFKTLISCRKKSKGGKPHLPKFRSRKDSVQSCPIQKQNISKKGDIYATLLGSILKSEPISGSSDGRIVHENNCWYYCESILVPVSRPENQRLQTVALDPGVRTFMTLFSPELIGKIGEGAVQRIYRLCLAVDKLKSRQAASTAKRRYRLKKAEKRIRNRIQNLIRELHYKTASFLCENFNTILLPSFEVKDMVSKISRKITTRSVKQMLSLSHYKFKLRLKSTAERMGATVIDVNEAFTSKTCSSCGKIHNIGGSKTLTCSCGVVMDRDVNGARGIYLRALRDHSCALNLCTA